MPLDKNDPLLDYDGSWGIASKNWPCLVFPSEQEAEEAYVIAHKFCKIPYGSYILVRTQLRLETEEYLFKVRVELKERNLANVRKIQK